MVIQIDCMTKYFSFFVSKIIYSRCLLESGRSMIGQSQISLGLSICVYSSYVPFYELVLEEKFLLICVLVMNLNNISPYKPRRFLR